ncbi:MAG: AAA family ATPase [Lachnospiraceae bacterium]|nr:AAA family ATPase [Lachnospiraceae bacterium]
MSRFNLIKPDIHTGYLNDGKGQEVTYLQIPENLTIEELEEDIKNGASHFGNTRDYLKEKPSRFTVINCSNEETGLMAVSYIASVYNQREGLPPDDYEDGEMEDSFELVFDDYDEDAEVLWADDYDSLNDYGQEDWESDSIWIESPWRIPVITMNQLLLGGGNNINSLFMGNMSMGGMDKTKNNLPFWHYTRREGICITCDIGQFATPFGVNEEQFVRAFQRYSKNRHVYFVAYSSGKKDNTNFFRIVSEDDDTDTLDAMHQGISNIILEYCAGCVDAILSEKTENDYYFGILEDWVEKYGYTLRKGFDKKRINELLTSSISSDKAAFLEKVVKFVIKHEPEPKCLEEKDFDIFEKFKMIGSYRKKAEKKTALRLDGLIGMESVKEQIQGIVQVMKYQKKRKKLGLSGNDYHNVHLMLGAPGTAKTTVAEILGNMMSDQKLLNGTNFISVNGAELKGMYVGHSAPKVKALFDQYDIILIDEAYAIAAGEDGSSDSFSQEAIAQLIIELEKHGMDRLVIFAGYGGKRVSQKDNRMKDFLNANPGIRSRINSTIYFDSYTPNEMVKIFRQHAKQAEYRVSSRADVIIKEFFEKRYRCSDFGNGREARSLLENSVVEAAKRLAQNKREPSIREMKELKIEDIKRAIATMTDASEQQNGMTVEKFGFAI